LEIEGGVISTLFQKANRRWRADGDYAMKNDTTKTPADVANEKLFDNWFDPVETELRTKVRGLHRDHDRRRT
jgi:hypothetical protein